MAGPDALKRVCIECGMRSGMYPRGSKVKHSVVCRRCGVLGEPKDTWTWRWSDPRRTWQVSVYCQGCCDAAEVVGLTWNMYMHEQRWGKYERGMNRGKAYRLEKGRRLREESAVVGKKGEEVAVANTDERKPRYCITMKERRLCDCHPDTGFELLRNPPYLGPQTPRLW